MYDVIEEFLQNQLKVFINGLMYCLLPRAKKNSLNCKISQFDH